MWSPISAAIGVALLVLVPSMSADSGVPVQERFNIDHFCFRRLNETHQVGCASSNSGNVGVVHVIGSDADVQYVTKSGPNNLYVPVIADIDISDNYLNEFIKSKRVAGVLIIRNGSTPVSFSPDDTCPNRFSNFRTDASNCSWNDQPENKMNATFFRDFPFPIFYLKNDTIIRKVKQCFESFGRPVTRHSTFDKRKCAVKLYSPMNAAVSTETCLRRQQLSVYITAPRGFCDPLGDQNLVTIVPASQQGPFANETVILAARMDTFTMFDGLAPGADTAVTGIASIIAAADAIQRHQAGEKRTTQDRNILFALFNGEAFDYIGSSRFVYDLLKRSAVYNITSLNVSSLIEFNQLIPSNDKRPQWFAHVDSVQYNDSAVTQQTLDRIVKELSRDGFNVKPVKNGPLPPSSAHSFIRSMTSLPSVVITNHEGRYVNKYYNSIFDDDSHRVKDLAKLAEQLRIIVKRTSETVLRLAKSKVTDEKIEVDVNATLIENLLECFLVNSSCPLFHTVVNEQLKGLPREKPYQLYIGVGQIHQQVSLAYLTMAYATGEIVPNITDMTSCIKLKKKNTFEYFDWMFGPDPTDEQPGICVRHRATIHSAKSPYFDDVQGEKKDNYLKHSSWTESVWPEPHLELFVQASGRCELVALLSGVAMLVIFSVISLLVYRQADLIFDQASPVAC